MGGIEEGGVEPSWVANGGVGPGCLGGRLDPTCVKGGGIDGGVEPDGTPGDSFDGGVERGGTWDEIRGAAEVGDTGGSVGRGGTWGKTERSTWGGAKGAVGCGCGGSGGAEREGEADGVVADDAAEASDRKEEPGVGGVPL